MSTQLVTVHHGEPVSKVRQLIREHGIHHLPVVSGQKLVGIISNSDVLRVSFGDTFQADERAVDATLDHIMTIEQLMQKDPVFVRENAPIREAAQLLVSGDFHSLPVVSDGQKLVGLVTSTDLIRYLLEQFQRLACTFAMERRLCPALKPDVPPVGARISLAARSA